MQVRDAKRLKVTQVVEKEDRRHRPAGLNTVELLKVRQPKEHCHWTLIPAVTAFVELVETRIHAATGSNSICSASEGEWAPSCVARLCLL